MWLRRAFLSQVLRVGFFIAFLSTLILVICICRHYAKGWNRMIEFSLLAFVIDLGVVLDF